MEGVRASSLGEAAVGFDDLVTWDAGFALEAVDVLREELEQQPFLV